jgi:hypothetical protein
MIVDSPITRYLRSWHIMITKITHRWTLTEDFVDHCQPRTVCLPSLKYFVTGDISSPDLMKVLHKFQSLSQGEWRAEPTPVSDFRYLVSQIRSRKSALGERELIPFRSRYKS